MQRLTKRIGLTAYLNAPHQVRQHHVCLPGLSQDGYAGLHPYLVCGEQGAFADDVGVLDSAYRQFSRGDLAVEVVDFLLKAAQLPKEKGAGSWQVCSPKTSSGFSAVGYYFGRRLLKELNVPIGLIGSNWGGTRIEPWTTLAGFQSVPELSKIAQQVKGYKENTRVGGGTPAAIYNSMVHPLTPFAMRGAIWYQGESNGGEHMTYYHKKHALVKGWRKALLGSVGKLPQT